MCFPYRWLEQMQQLWQSMYKFSLAIRQQLNILPMILKPKTLSNTEVLMLQTYADELNENKQAITKILIINWTCQSEVNVDDRNFINILIVALVRFWIL